MENLAKEEDVIRREAQAELEKKRKNIQAEYAARLEGLVRVRILCLSLRGFMHILWCGEYLNCDVFCCCAVCYVRFSMCVCKAILLFVTCAGSGAGGGSKEASIRRDCEHDAQAGRVP